MIKFNSLSREIPYLIFKEKYDLALSSGQKNIEAVSISSYDIKKKEVDSRFVNIKFLNKKDFIFFSNYKSPKSNAFSYHNQISALIYWPSINVQIRMKSKIKKTPSKFNNDYFKLRSKSKNALAISSNQSKIIPYFDDVKEKYEDVKKKNDLTKCPDYWGGFSFAPYSFEFWEGNDFRLNKRDLYLNDNKEWNHYVLEP